MVILINIMVLYQGGLWTGERFSFPKSFPKLRCKISLTGRLPKSPGCTDRRRAIIVLLCDHRLFIYPSPQFVNLVLVPPLAALTVTEQVVVLFHAVLKLLKVKEVVRLKVVAIFWRSFMFDIQISIAFRQFSSTTKQLMHRVFNFYCLSVLAF